MCLVKLQMACLFVYLFNASCSTAQTVGVTVSTLVATGGEEEGMAAYEESMQAIFGLQLERYSHVQPHRNPGSGKLRWECLEMWPMQASLALVCCAGAVIHTKVHVQE